MAYGSESGTAAAVYAPLAILSPVITKRDKARKAPARKPKAPPSAPEAPEAQQVRAPKRRAEPGDRDRTIKPTRADAAASASIPAATEAPIDGAQLDAAILRFLRRFPNRSVDLGPLADELGLDPYRVQLAVEDLGRRRMVVVPFIEPGTAGGAELTAVGLRWLLEREGGSPADQPAALVPAKRRVRAEDEAERLPRASVYGVSRGS